MHDGCRKNIATKMTIGENSTTTADTSITTAPNMATGVTTTITNYVLILALAPMSWSKNPASFSSTTVTSAIIAAFGNPVMK